MFWEERGHVIMNNDKSLGVSNRKKEEFLLIFDSRVWKNEISPSFLALFFLR
jgi:hypothetical protein